MTTNSVKELVTAQFRAGEANMNYDDSAGLAVSGEQRRARRRLGGSGLENNTDATVVSMDAYKAGKMRQDGPVPNSDLVEEMKNQPSFAQVRELQAAAVARPAAPALAPSLRPPGM